MARSRMSLKVALEASTVQMLKEFTRQTGAISFQFQIGTEQDVRKGELVSIPLTDRSLSRSQLVLAVARRPRPAGRDPVLSRRRWWRGWPPSPDPVSARPTAHTPALTRAKQCASRMRAHHPAGICCTAAPWTPCLLLQAPSPPAPSCSVHRLPWTIRATCPRWRRCSTSGAAAGRTRSSPSSARPRATAASTTSPAASSPSR